MTKNLEVIKGSENVFRDLQLEDAAYLLVKADLIHKIQDIVSKNILNKDQIADKLSLHVKELDIILYTNNARSSDKFTFKQLMSILEKLGYEATLNFRKIQ